MDITEINFVDYYSCMINLIHGHQKMIMSGSNFNPFMPIAEPKTV